MNTIGFLFTNQEFIDAVERGISEYVSKLTDAEYKDTFHPPLSEYPVE